MIYSSRSGTTVEWISINIMFDVYVFTWENFEVYIHILAICDNWEMQHDSNDLVNTGYLLDNSMSMCEMLSSIYELL